MNNIGILKDNRGKAGTILSPKEIASFNNEVNFILTSGAGEPLGFSDQDYENVGCFITYNNNEVIKYSDITIVHDEINLSLGLSSEKIFLTDINYNQHFASLITMIGEPIRLFAFSPEMNKKSDSETRFPKDYYLGFLKYYLGEPVSSEMIDYIASNKILEQGKITNQKIIQMINTI